MYKVLGRNSDKTFKKKCLDSLTNGFYKCCRVLKPVSYF